MEMMNRGMITNIEGITDWNKTELKAFRVTYRITQPEELDGKSGVFMLPLSVAPPSVGSMVVVGVTAIERSEEDD